ncbi:MAG TPA: hypothetical protein ACHBZ9_16100 [Arsenophonus nasoniae]|uniref:hypothetical protein n=1 Tax=Arsenophonus nasoniae TaxID=638 RepID=UPI0038797E06
MDNIQSTLSSTNSVSQYNTSSYGDGMESISQINELMMMLTEMLKKLRNTLQEFNQKQQELGWNIQVASMDKKREGIDHAYDAAMFTGTAQILAGTASLIGMGTGASFGSAAITQLGGQIGHSGGQLLQGTMQMHSANDTKLAELDKLTGELQTTNAQNYAKNTNDLADKIRQVSEQMRAFTKDLVELHGRISSSIRH